MSDSHPIDPRLAQVLNFPLVSGLLGRRSRRFGYAMTIHLSHLWPFPRALSDDPASHLRAGVPP